MAAYSRSRPLIALLFAAALAGCATGARPPALKRQHLALAFEAQTASNLCGHAVADMLAAYYHKPLSASELEGLQDEARTTDGVSGASLKLVFQEAGYFVAVFPGTLDWQEAGVFRHLDLQRPLIVMTGRRTRHYSLAIGYDERQGTIELMDPAMGPFSAPLQEFMKEWKEANYFTLLAMPDR